MADQQETSPVMAGEQGRPIFPPPISPETAGMTELIAPRPRGTSRSSSSTLSPTPAAHLSPPSPSSDERLSASCASISHQTGPARPHSQSTPDPTTQRKLITRSASEGLPVALRVSLAGRRAATSEMPPNLSGDHPFFYEFDEYSPSDSDTTSSSSEGDGQLEESAPTRKKLKRRATDKSLEQGPKSEDQEDAVPTRRYSRFSVGNQYFKTKGKVSKLDGRLKISVNETANSGWLAKTLGSGIRHHLGIKEQDEAEDVQSPDTTEHGEGQAIEAPKQIPKLNIVIIVIGSRGDIQPFLKVGKILKNDHGHRVRIATHPAFKDFVEKDSGLDFFSVGGDPSELMAFMVKNPGLIPSVETVKAGEIGKRRKSMYEMFNGMWRACINTTDDENDKENLKMSKLWLVHIRVNPTSKADWRTVGDKHPFIADAIIANPPSFAHVHIAERLGIPLHMMFTFPYTPTTQFPHPLANIKQSNIDESYTNFMSYPLVEMMTWQGLGDLVNKFRVKTLGLDPVSTLWAPGQLYRLKVPYTYMWSPTLVPKPSDWGPEVNVTGFTFLDLASSFTPPDALTRFLVSGPPPVYIGFGSIVVDDPDAFTQMIFRAVSLAGVRALVSKGWGGIGGEDDAPENIFLLDNTPHDWLFPRVSAVVHHGGAGTTAIGLKCGKPTMIVPFFGDQPFWGAMVAKAKAGAHECIPYKKLNAERLAEGIEQCLSDEARQNATKIAERIEREGDGATNAVAAFHSSLPLAGESSMRCALLEERVATWHLKEKGKWKKNSVKLSPLAAEILTEQKRLKWSDLRLARMYDWNDFEGPGEPISGVGGAVTGTVVEATQGIGSVPGNIIKSVKKHGRHEHKKRKLAKKKEKQQKSLEKAGVLETDPADQQPSQDAEPPSQQEGPRESIEQTASDDEQKQEDHQPDPEEPDPSKQRPGAPTRASTTLSTLASPDEPLPAEVCRTTGHGIHQTTSALARAPVDLAFALAQGFHNAPRLYGDDTVRAPVRITGWHSALRASRREFVYGLYDGWTGLWKQPARGWQEKGVGGAVRGVGLGVGGLVLKNVSAVVGPVGFCAKGLHREVGRKRRGGEAVAPLGFVRRARLLQGRGDERGINGEEERRDLEERVLRAFDVLEEEAEERRAGGRRRKHGGKGVKRGSSDAKEEDKENKELTPGQRPVPRRRSTLKKKRPPPKKGEKAQHKTTAVAEENRHQDGPPPLTALPTLPQVEPTSTTRGLSRGLSTQSKRSGHVFDVHDDDTIFPPQDGVDDDHQQQLRFDGFRFHDYNESAPPVPAHASPLTSHPATAAPEVKGKDSMAEDVVPPGKVEEGGVPALVRGESDTVDFALVSRSGNGNGGSGRGGVSVG